MTRDDIDSTFRVVEDRMWKGLSLGDPWRAGARLAAKRLEIEPALALEGAQGLGALYGRVATDPGDARRFVLPDPADAAAWAKAPPALIVKAEDERTGAPDLVAFSLSPGSRRFWRAALAVAWLGDISPDAGGTMRLFQDAHGWLGRVLKAEAYRRRARDERAAVVSAAMARAREASGLASFAAAVARPIEDANRKALIGGYAAALRAGDAAAARWDMAGRWPDGALVLDPAAIPWTRKGALVVTETIEIADAPASGPLARAICAQNSSIGGARGVNLIGQPEPSAARAGRRAA